MVTDNFNGNVLWFSSKGDKVTKNRNFKVNFYSRMDDVVVDIDA